MLSESEMNIKLAETKRYLLAQGSLEETPALGIILGSGLGRLADLVENPKVIPYREIPNFPVSTVAGHAGQLVFGWVEGKYVMVMQGRFHFYEGYDMAEVTYPVRVMQALGLKGLIVTNAAGGVNFDFKAGDLALITDHLNMLGVNPLRGANLSDFGARFPDMSEAYDVEWRKRAWQTAQEMGLPLQKGVYAAFSGPSYETPAEICYARMMGADMVGMSTVPEVIVANHGGMRVLGISCITNMAAGVLPRKLSHAEVMETAQRIETEFVRFVANVVRVL
ncbi:MAG: purine-nucleoside phosphorylase [Peptococcaceae bacterium]|nr:purine-nucleoside phosphorylase [Peptococcaceae bacterium]